MSSLADETLWSWSLRAMDVRAVREAALTLQDGHGLNASLALWAAWCELSGFDLADEDVRRIVGGVHGLDRYVVRRLREVRRHAASPRPGYDERGLSSLRREVYRAELSAEKLIQTRLEAETRATCTASERLPGLGVHLLALCAASLETPVLLADDLGAAGPTGLFGKLLGAAPPLAQDPLAQDDVDEECEAPS